MFFLLATLCYASLGLLLRHWHVSPLDAPPLLGEPLGAVTLAGVALVMIGAVLGATHQAAKWGARENGDFDRE